MPCCALWAAVSQSAHPAGAFQDVPQIPEDGESRTDIYLNDSFEAQDAIRSGLQLARSGRWTQAADILQRTSDELGEKLVAMDGRRYVGVRRHVADIIADWPAEGIASYRAVVDVRLARELRGLLDDRNLRALLLLLERYYSASQSPALIDSVVDLALEAGELQLASRVLTRAIDHHPDRNRHLPKWRGLREICSAFKGTVQDVGPPAGETELRWMGKQTALEDIIRDIGDSLTGPQAAGDTRDRWLVFGGDGTRSRVGDSTIDQMGLIWRYQAANDRADAENTDGFDAALGRARVELALSAHAVTDDQYVVLQRHREVLAIHRNSGALAWRFQPDVADDESMQEAEERGSAWESVVIDGDRVYAALPGDVIPFYGFESARIVTELVCLDLHTGSLLWRINQDSLGDAFHELQLDAAPLVAQNRLFVVGRRRRSFGFEDCYLYAFATANGELVFRTHLGSATAGTFGMRRPTMSIPSMDSDTVFVCSNLGSIAAVGIHTGAVRWLVLYDRIFSDAVDDSHGWNSYDLRPWEFNPVYIVDDRVLVLPNDADSLFVLDKDSGRQRQAVARDVLGGMRTIYGVRGNVLCGVGSEANCYDIDEDRLQWASPLPRNQEAIGRGAWVDDRLLVPTHDRLCSFQVSDGTRTDEHWDQDGTPGNLLALPDQLIVAGIRSVSSYVRKEQIWASLRGRMKAAPTDPVPALELAEIAFGSGEVDDALEALAEAATRIAGGQANAVHDSRSRLHTDAVEFASRLSARDALDDGKFGLLLEYAATFAGTPESHLHYRIRFAELAERADDGAVAVGLLQQVLLDRSLSDLPAPARDAARQTAGAYAQARVRDLIDKYGRDVYAVYEDGAAALLVRGLRDATESTLWRVIREYPNSQAAPKALMAVGKRRFDAGDGEAAARIFVQAYHRFRKRLDPVPVMRSIADAYIRAGREDAAYLWLTKAAQEHPSALIDVNGRQITLDQYRLRVAHVRDLVEPNNPRIVLPLTAQDPIRPATSFTLLEPRFPHLPAHRWGVYYVQLDGQINAYESNTQNLLWTRELPGAQEHELLFAGDSVVVLASNSAVTCVHAGTGALRWRFSPQDEPQGDDVPDDWEAQNRLRHFAFHRDRMVVSQSNGHLSCLTVDDGIVVWTQKRVPPSAGVIQFNEEWVTYFASGPGRPTLIRLDTADGSIQQSFPSADSRPVEHLLLTLTGRMIVATSQSVAAYDVGSPEPRWRNVLTGHLKPDSLAMDIGALYFSEDGRQISKYSLESGALLWTSERLHPRGAGPMRAMLVDGQVIAATPSSVTSIDAVTGVLLWQGVAPDDARFATHLVTDRYIIAVHVPEDGVECVAYCYEHRNASGLIPADGGAIALESLNEFNKVLALDSALLISADGELLPWIKQP